jgi:tRNA(Ile2) C34 agmatinyltransferase TiaS
MLLESEYKPRRRPLCAECGARLDAEEIKYYGHRCEGCERRWHDQMIAANTPGGGEAVQGEGR